MSIKNGPSRIAGLVGPSGLIRFLDLNAQEVAARAGLHPSTLSRYRRGKQSLSAEAKERLELAILREIVDEAE